VGAAGAAAAGGYAKLWVGIGKKDNVRPGDLVGALANQAQVPADAIGRIEVRDLFCLVEVRADQAERAAQGLTGVTVKGRRLIARVDRGPGARHRPPRRV
jgi:ATP-dependent RNA helicase DeaD